MTASGSQACRSTRRPLSRAYRSSRSGAPCGGRTRVPPRGVQSAAQAARGPREAGKGRGRPERLTIDGRVVLSPDIDGNERYELATDGHALAGATARQPVTRDTACWASCRPTTRTAFRLRPAALLICSACDPICSACDPDRRADGCTTEPQGAAFAGASCDGPTRGVEPG